jgi:hypothetical protein
MQEELKVGVPIVKKEEEVWAIPSQICENEIPALYY